MHDTPTRLTTLAQDFKAGFLVFLIALPLCLGISLASGFPPFAGVVTAIIGGLVVSPLMGAKLTIKGPAAGLITIALGAVTELGHGDTSAGYHAALAVGLAAGIMQIVFGLMKVGKLSDFFPTAAVHGMLAAIGVIIIAKQIHVVFGMSPHAVGPLGLLAEAPSSAMHMQPAIGIIGLGSLAILFAWQYVPIKALRKIPAHFIVLAFAIPASQMFDLVAPHHYIGRLGEFDLGPKFLVSVPAHLVDMVATPDLSVLAESQAWAYVVMFALVGTLESMLTAKAIDNVSGAKVSSNLDRDNLAVGIGNTLSALLGGLPMISEVVRSKANLDNGAKSRFANFVHGAMLLLCIALIPRVVHMIPLAALAAMLVYTGCRLASPKELMHMLKIGKDQFAVFMVTLLVTLSSDLLKGIFAGLVVEAALHFAWGARLKAIVKVTAAATVEHGHTIIAVTSHATFANFMSLRQRITAVDPKQRLVVDFSQAPLVDHSVFQRLQEVSAQRAAGIEVIGLEGFMPLSAHPAATRRRASVRGLAGEASHA